MSKLGPSHLPSITESLRKPPITIITLNELIDTINIARVMSNDQFEKNSQF
jgi:hypothetical protein